MKRISIPNRIIKWMWIAYLACLVLLIAIWYINGGEYPWVIEFTWRGWN